MSSASLLLKLPCPGAPDLYLILNSQRGFWSICAAPAGFEDESSKGVAARRLPPGRTGLFARGLCGLCGMDGMCGVEYVWSNQVK
jgi:hypothetical protein